MAPKKNNFGGDSVAYAYSGQDGNGSLPYFVGKQYGGGWLKSLARIAFPILKRVVGAAGNIAANTAEDMLENRKKFKQSLRDNAVGEAKRVFNRKRKNKSTAINSLKKPAINRRNTIFA